MSLLGDPPAWVIVLEFCFALLIFVGFVPLGYPGLIKRTYGETIPEARPLKDTLSGFVSRVGPEGLPTYRRELERDIPFAVLFGTLLALLVRQVFVRALATNPGALRWCVAVAIAYLVTDVVEDVTLLQVVADSNISWEDSAPTFRSGTIAQRARWVTLLKFVFLIASLIAIGLGAVLLAIRGAPTS